MIAMRSVEDLDAYEGNRDGEKVADPICILALNSTKYIYSLNVSTVRESKEFKLTLQA